MVCVFLDLCTVICEIWEKENINVWVQFIVLARNTLKFLKAGHIEGDMEIRVSMGENCHT